MLLVTQDTAIHEIESGPIIMGIKAGTQLWSLESNNG
jgi:hypothetical protein